MVQYKVKKEKLKEVEKAIKEFVAAVKKNEPSTLIYEAFQLNDKVSFAHFMAFRDEKSKKLHETSEYVKKFVSVLYPSCKEEPVFTNLNLVASNKD